MANTLLSKTEIVEAFRYSERTQLSFDELALLVNVLLEEMREVSKDTPAILQQDEETLFALLGRLCEKFEDIPY